MMEADLAAGFTPTRKCLPPNDAAARSRGRRRRKRPEVKCAFAVSSASDRNPFARWSGRNRTAAFAFGEKCAKTRCAE